MCRNANPSVAIFSELLRLGQRFFQPLCCQSFFGKNVGDLKPFTSSKMFILLGQYMNPQWGKLEPTYKWHVGT